MNKFEEYLEAVKSTGIKYKELNPVKDTDFMSHDKKDRNLMSPKNLVWRLEMASGVRFRENPYVHLFLRPYNEGESKSSLIPSDVKKAVDNFIKYVERLGRLGTTVDLSAETPKVIGKKKGWYIQLTEKL